MTPWQSTTRSQKRGRDSPRSFGVCVEAASSPSPVAGSRSRRSAQSDASRHRRSTSGCRISNAEAPWFVRRCRSGCCDRSSDGPAPWCGFSRSAANERCRCRCLGVDVHESIAGGCFERNCATVPVPACETRPGNRFALKGFVETAPARPPPFAVRSAFTKTPPGCCRISAPWPRRFGASPSRRTLHGARYCR